MMGRAGRPQFDDKGIACVFVHAPKKVRMLNNNT
jgi:replicative superfamily II helicase